MSAPSADWEARSEALWGSFGEDTDEAAFRAEVDALAAELPDGDPVAPFERACAWDSTGHPERAVPLYRQALAAGLDPYRRRRASIQLASSLRNLGHVNEALAVLEDEQSRDGADELGDALAVFVALVLADLGRSREGLGLVLEAIAPHLPRYQNSVRTYGRALLP